MPALPPYRLQTVLEVRERKKTAAEQAFALALAELRREQKRLAEMEAELVRMQALREQRRREYLERAMKGDMSAQEVITANVFIERLQEMEAAQKDAIVGQKAIIEQREEDVAATRIELVKANQDLKALEKHKEKWLEEVKKARAAREEDVMDEMAQMIFLRNPGGGRGES